jgi:hypothetical protein
MVASLSNPDDIGSKQKEYKKWQWTILKKGEIEKEKHILAQLRQVMGE